MPPAIPWRIAAGPVRLARDEFRARYDHLHMPEKFEACDGKLFWDDTQRLHVLAMLLEAVGLRRALELCPPEAVREAVAASAIRHSMIPGLATLHAATEQAKPDGPPPALTPNRHEGILPA